MNQEGILIEVKKGRVTRVSTNGAPLPAGAAVTYDDADTRLMAVREPLQAEQIERIAAALREGRANTQRHGIRKACEKAAGHYQAIAQATGALATLLADLRRTDDGDPVALVTRMQEAVNRIDDDVLREVRQQLLIACAAAMEPTIGADHEEEEEQRPPFIPPIASRPLPGASEADAPRESSDEKAASEPPRVASYTR